MKSKEKEQLNDRINELMNQRDDYRQKYFESYKRANNLEKENQRLARLNEILTQAICGAWREGTFIVYDEHNPRNICVIKDGKCIDANKATQVSFNWYKNEFPSLEVTTE